MPKERQKSSKDMKEIGEKIGYSNVLLLKIIGLDIGSDYLFYQVAKRMHQHYHL